MIELQNICKQYRITKREPGLSNAFKALLKRNYTTVNALRDISFSIKDGEMVGYIGPNGAGKSTTIKIMCGVLTPDSGSCSINGRTPWTDRKEHVRHIGVVFGQRSQLWWDVPVLDSFVGAVYTYAEYDSQLLKRTPKLTAIYTMKNATGDLAEKNIPFESLTSGAYSVLAKGAEGNTVIYRLSSSGEDGYTYEQDYTVTFKRIPTLTAISLTDQDGADQAPTMAFDGKNTAYTYKVLDTVSSVTVKATPLVDGYEITVNGQNAKNGAVVQIRGDTVITVKVSSNGVSNSYQLNIQP